MRQCRKEEKPIFDLPSTPTASQKQSGQAARIPGKRRPCGLKGYSGKRFWTLFGRMQKVSEISNGYSHILSNVPLNPEGIKCK
ncbi:MAG TPA: hypothetical protein PKL31_12720 [Fulvivirga sp.]|nr:hypothetical protein [Fulvivirga sp.]